MTAPGDLDHLELPTDTEGLFGVPVAPGTVMWNPTPHVDIDGLRIEAAPTADLTGVVALGGLRVAWGSDQPLDQAPPATASVSLMDFTRRWATTREPIGLPVVLSWSSPLPAERVFFRGRITEVTLTRVDVRTRAGGTVPAIRVDLACASIETDLANRFPTETAWPRELVRDRVSRIAAYCTGVAGSDAVIVRDFWEDAVAAAVDDVHQTSIRDLLVQLYNSTGADRMVYSPHRQSYEFLHRRTSSARSLLRLWIPGPTNFRRDQGVYVGPDFLRTATGVDTAVPVAGLSLDADDLEYDEGMTRQAADRITRVRLTYTDETTTEAKLSEKGLAAKAIADYMDSHPSLAEDWTWNGAPQYVLNHHDALVAGFYQANPGSNWPASKPQAAAWLRGVVTDETAQGSTKGETRTIERIAPGAREDIIGQRVVTFDSLHAVRSWWAELNAEDLLASATQENSTWRPGRFRWDTRRTGGLYNHSLCELLLRGHQVGWPVAINRSWPAALGVRPLFSVTGGVITYEGSTTGLGRGWVIDIDAAGWGSWGGGNATPTPIRQHAITFEEIDDGTTVDTVRWRDTDAPDGLHSSVTFEDLGHVGRGRGNTTIGPDTGWDTTL